ncbi:unnamed protein product [Bathycoccus prasinos]
MSHHFLTNHNYSVQPKSSSSPSKIINTIKSTTTPTTNKRKHSYYYPTTTTMASAKIGPTQSPLLANQPKDTINLAVGHPMHSELPNKIISDALKRCGSKLKHNQLDLNYIPSEGPTGAVEELCSFLRRQYKEEEKEEEMRVTGYQAKTEQNENDETKMQSKAETTATTKNVLQPEDLFFTSGVSHGIEMATSILAKPNDIVVCEKATYFLATKIFEDHDMEITTVKSNEFGLDVNALKIRLEEGDTFINPINSILENVGATPRKKRKVLFRPKLVYIVPTHSNPQGVTMPQKAREELVRLAHEYKFHIIADEVYHILSWSKEPLPDRFCKVERKYLAKNPEEANGDFRAVVSVSSFTKILAPALRVGWIETADSVMRGKFSKRGYIISGGNSAGFSANVVCEAIKQTETEAFMNDLKGSYASRCAVLCNKLEREGCGWEFEKPSGGYFVWIKLPEGVTSKSLEPYAQHLKVAYLAGERCSANDACKEDLERYIRLCFAHLSASEIQEGVSKLSEAVLRVMSFQDVESKRLGED